MLCDIPENKTALCYFSKDICFCLKSGLVLKGFVICLVLLRIKVSNLFLFSITRLSKLETFQKIVVEELASLEKETQMLADMEKDAVVCRTSRVPTGGGTPSQIMRVFFGALFRTSGMHSCSN